MINNNIQNIPSLSVWLQNTNVRFSVRGSKLRAIDNAIKRNDADHAAQRIKETTGNLHSISMALEAWKKAQGVGEKWKSHPRNKKGEFTKLNDILGRERHIGTQSYHQNLSHARLGVIYLFAHLDVNARVASILLLPAVSIAGFLNGQISSNPHDLFGQAGNTAADHVSQSVTDGIRFAGEPIIAGGGAVEDAMMGAKTMRSTSLFLHIVDWLSDFARKIGHNLIELFYRQEIEDGPYVIQVSMILSTVKAAITMAGTIVCETFTGIASDSTRLLRHLTRIADAAVDAIRSWWRSRTVSILFGHPSMICDTLKSSMTGQVKKGIYNTMKASAGIALQLLLPLVGSAIRAVGNMLLSIFETIYNLIEHYVVLQNIRGIAYQCQHFWKAYKETQMQPLNARKALFHEDSERFATWYCEIARTSPELIALTLNSGICGNKMEFLNMFNTDKGKLITQEQFSSGVEYVDSLKDYSTNLLIFSDYRFSSDKSDVQGYINNAQKFTRNQENKAWKFIKKAADV